MDKYMAKNKTKKDLILAISRRTGISKDITRLVLESYMDEVKMCLLCRHSIEIRGFGTYYLKHRKGRPARNIRTGEVVKLLDRDVPSFKFCDAFQEAVGSSRCH